MLDEPQAKLYGAELGYQFVEIPTMFKWFLADRLRMRSLALPLDPPDRVMGIMQFVEKRIARSIPQPVKDSRNTLLLGFGSTKWERAKRTISEAGFTKPWVAPWPSERSDNGDGNFERGGRVD